MKFLDREGPQSQAIVPLHITRSPYPLGWRLRLGPDPATQLDSRSQPGGFRPPYPWDLAQFGPWPGGKPPQRAIPPQKYLGGHREGVLPTCPCSKENGQKLLRRQRGGPDRPETLARPVVFEVLGETQRHGQD